MLSSTTMRKKDRVKLKNWYKRSVVLGLVRRRYVFYHLLFTVDVIKCLPGADLNEKPNQTKLNEMVAK